MECMCMERILYAGDSTVQLNKIDTYPQTGMGQVLSLYTRDGVEVKNFAKNGRSTKSFIDEGRLAAMERELRPGDLLLVQFGHNDEKDDPARHTCPDTDFQENLLRFAQAAKERGARAVFVTPIARRLFDAQGRFCAGSHGAYPEAVKAAAARAGVPVVDLTSITEAYLERVGDLWSRPLFVWPKDNTHLKYEGAILMAGFLVKELKKLGEPYRGLFEAFDAGKEKG